jgi:hypothetical protein
MIIRICMRRSYSEFRNHLQESRMMKYTDFLYYLQGCHMNIIFRISVPYTRFIIHKCSEFQHYEQFSCDCRTEDFTF